MQTLQQGSLLQGGKYKIEKVLGQGGFGITYLGEQIALGRKVAVKEFFMKELCNRDETTSCVSVGSEGSREMVAKFREKFLKEARNIASLKHQSIVSVIDVFEENGTAYYVMEYCEGGSLSSMMKDKYAHGMPAEKALKYIRQIAGALDYVHKRKMNHLDVKPANIMLNDEDDAVLIDFGLSKQYDAQTGQQTSSTPVGISEGYAPMEQYKKGGVSEFSPSTDIYSLGATLFKLITGQTPPNANDVFNEGLPELPASVSKNISAAISAAMQPRKSDRPQSVKAWLDILLSEPKDIEPEVTILPDDVTVVSPDANPGKKSQPKTDPKPEPKPKAEPKPTPEPAAKPEKPKIKSVYVILIAAVVIIASVMFNFFSRTGEYDADSEYDYIEEAVPVEEEYIYEADSCAADSCAVFEDW